MANPIKIFICYKKVLSRESEGKTVLVETSAAPILHEILGQAQGRYQSWMDDDLAAGMEWETKIYNNILTSDVLLVLIGTGTSKSPWVQREIALANALGISVLPLGFGLTWEEMERELKELGLNKVQGKITQNIRLKSREALLQEIQQDLELAAQQTKTKQEETLKGLLSRRHEPQIPAPHQQKAETFQLMVGTRQIELHVSTGEIQRVRGIDALVNSENDYMQMARFFESRTVSSILRRLGASVRGGQYFDAIQQELDWQLRERGRPVQAAEVFATSTGGPLSDLARQLRAKYILHVAAVQAVPARSTVVPFSQPEQIENCMRACLSKAASINEEKGMISPPESPQFAEQKKRAEAGEAPIRSILFPLLGAGQGGVAPSEVLGPMLAGIEGFFRDEEDQQRVSVVNEIYISAYWQKDVNAVTSFIRHWVQKPRHG